VCGGRGICGHCQIVAIEGEFIEHGLVSTRASLTVISEDEQRYREKRGLASERRLGCKAQVNSDVIIDVPPESQLHRRVVRKRVERRDTVKTTTMPLFVSTGSGRSGFATTRRRSLTTRWLGNTTNSLLDGSRHRRTRMCDR